MLQQLSTKLLKHPAFTVKNDTYLTIVLEIQPQLTMWATSADRTRTIHIQTLTTLDGDNIKTSHGATRINMMQYLVDNTGLVNHLYFTSKIKGNETSVMINLVL